MYLEEWRSEPQYPDHFLKNRLNSIVEKESLLGKIILKVLDDLCEYFLDWNHDRLWVKEEYFDEWQDLITYISPLLLISRKVQQEANGCPIDPDMVEAYINRWLFPNLIHSALPHPYNPLIEKIIRHEGLIDLHCHLNGSPEFDYVWLDQLSKPFELYKDLRDSYFRSPNVRELYEQIEPSLKPVSIWKRLKQSRAVRGLICNHLFYDRYLTAQDFLQELQEPSPKWNTSLHPILDYFPFLEKCDELVLEAAYLTRLFEVIEETNNEDLAHSAYFSRLVYTQVMQLSIQQTRQKGFDQFNKIAGTESRVISDEKYKRTYSQVNPTEYGDIVFLEGRFCAKRY
jgi:hypothetical protein